MGTNWSDSSGGSGGARMIARDRAESKETPNQRAKRVLKEQTGMTDREIESVVVLQPKGEERTYVIEMKDVATSNPPVPAVQEMERWLLHDLELPAQSVRMDEGTRKVIVDGPALEIKFDIKPKARGYV